MKKIICMILTILILFTSGLTCYAEDTSMDFMFELTTDGKGEKQVETGDIITVTFKLKRTDSDAAYTMYGMQNEILYDSEFFELVEGSITVSNGIKARDLQLRDGGKALYMNYASLSGGDTWNSDKVIGSFQLKVIGTKGSSSIVSSSNIVSTKDGTNSYKVNSHDITATIFNKGTVNVETNGSSSITKNPYLAEETLIPTVQLNEYTVSFKTNGGSNVDDQIIELGKKIKEPSKPSKEGYYFEGWYKDIYLTQKWNFEQDTVSGNMTLYAKWSVEDAQDEPPTADKTQTIPKLGALAIIAFIVALLLIGNKTVVFNTQGASKISPRMVRKGKTIKAPKSPTKQGCTFKGWYKDPECSKAWNFEEDKVESNITLFAKWDE